ncbi:S-layer homology domain-containing protein [Cohnella fermenti]|uniref:S-layer homology domain-containing protein n=1 Tax=Cohnella fermenti TaxID=2565925 RepID=A0A4S4BPQ2_9BACL|nr:S-layer homology domain-containing protein [Cohnella fermenti]
MAIGRKRHCVSGWRESITREELAVVIARLLYVENTDLSGLSVFVDSDQIASWSAPAVAWLVEKQLLKGYPDGTFRPKQSLTRAEAVTVLTRALALSQPALRCSRRRGHMVRPIIRLLSTGMRLSLPRM